MKNKNETKINIYQLLIFLILIIYCVSLLMPLIWGTYSSFKSNYEFRNNVFGLPEKWTEENFMISWKYLNVTVQHGSGNKTIYLEGLYLNSIIYSFGSALTSTLVPCIMAYLVSKYKCAFSTIINRVVLITMILPIVGSLPSEIQMTKMLGLYDTFLGAWILRANFLGMYFFVFQASFNNIPNTYMEAAKIDGASNYKVFFKIMFPLVLKTILMIFLLKFIDFWNDYQSPLIYIPNSPTIAFGLFNFNFSRENILSAIPVKLSGAMFVLVPILIVFLLSHKKLIGNLQMGGIKG